MSKWVITPMSNQVLLKQVKVDAGKDIVLEADRMAMEVLALGPEANTDFDVESHVIYLDNKAKKFDMGGDTYALVQDSDILGVVSYE